MRLSQADFLLEGAIPGHDPVTNRVDLHNLIRRV